MKINNIHAAIMPHAGIVPKTPVCVAYDACLVRIGLTDQPVALFNDRLCWIVSTHRTRVKRGYGYYNLLTISFLDGGPGESVPAGRFNKSQKTAPIPTDDDLRETVHSWLDLAAAETKQKRFDLVNGELRTLAESMAQTRCFGAYKEMQLRPHITSWQTLRIAENPVK